MQRPNLKGLIRRSICCHSDLMHPYAIESDECLTMQCVQCGKETDSHEVVNELGEVIWPCPDVELPARTGRKTLPGEADPEGFRIHLPRDVKRRILERGWLR